MAVIKRSTPELNYLTPVAQGISALGSQLSGYLSDGLFGDSEIGRSLGTIFSSGVSSATNTLSNNILKGNALTLGLGQNVGSSIGGAASGLAANYIGKGITSAMGNNYMGRATGAGVSNALGTIGGTAATNIAKTGKIGSLFGKAAGSINPYALAANVVGSALSAGNGPSKEYEGTYGKLTQGLDLAYDAAMIGVNAIPVFGLIISGAMALNKGLSNVFGSTSGMTVLDAILGSAFTPAPVKWTNMINAKTTSTFDNLSWLNSEKANSFMGDAFGNLLDKFDYARKEAGKTYGLASLGAYKRALNNLNFANRAWDLVLAMADLNELQNIRSQAMSSINNLKYAQDILGAWSPVARGRYGMKILNNATNHNMGMRLLSAAALIDNKQMILCNAHD